MAITREQYPEYVRALAARFPHLAPLRTFVSRRRPWRCQPDRITVFDVDIGGTLSKAQFQTIPLPLVEATHRGLEALAAKLENVPDTVSTRIITVSHLSPHAAALLGSRYDLSADFLNAHLPGHEVEPVTYLATDSSLALHIDFVEAYWVDNVLSTSLFPNHVQRSPGFHMTSSPFCDVFHSYHHWYYHPKWTVPELSDADRRRQTLWFLMQQRVSIYIKREPAIQTVIILHYPPPALHRDWDEDLVPVPLRKRHGTLVGPSQWSASSFNVATDVEPPSLGEHLALLLEKNAPCTRNGATIAVQQVFAALLSSLALTTAQVRQRVNDLGVLEILQSMEGSGNNHGADLLEMADAARNLQECARGAVEFLAAFPNDEAGLGSTSNRPTSNPVSMERLGEGELCKEWQPLKTRLEKTLDTLERLTERARQLSQTRLVYMQIAESRKAIEQADSVRRLTTLAFVFIPLTYVASVFGADILEMDSSRNAKTFAIASVATTAATILAALYLEQHLWPIVYRLLNKWRVHIFSTMSAIDGRDKTFGKMESVFLWKTYYWGSWNLGDKTKNWVLLPLATVDYGRLRVRQLFRKLWRREQGLPPSPSIQMPATDSSSTV